MSNSYFKRRIDKLRHWKSCWAEYPEHMEEVRKTGVAAMQQGWITRNDNLRQALREWPTSMTKREFRQRVHELIKSPANLRRKPHRINSMINRLRSKGFVRFNKETKTWINLTLY